jgi:hypothetical protein
MRSIVTTALSLVLFTSKVLADVIIVDDDAPGADYTSLQQAVDAATEGDLVLVGPGSYGGFLMGGQGTSIVAIPGTVTVVGRVEILGVPTGSTVVLRGLDIGPNWAALDTVLLIDGCDGSIRLDRCRVFGGHPELKTPAILVRESRDVVLYRVRALGVGGFTPSAWYDGLGARALETEASSLASYSNALLGGPGGRGDSGNSCLGFCCTDGGPGGAALRVDTDSSVFVAGGRLTGGPPGWPGSCACLVCSSGATGAAIQHETGRRLRLLDTAILGTVEGLSQDIPGSARTLVLPLPLTTGGSFPVQIAGEPLEGALLVLSLEGTSDQAGLAQGAQGVLHSWPPWRVFRLGALDSDGRLQTEIQLPEVSAGESLTVHAQVLLRRADGGLALSNTELFYLVNSPKFVDLDTDGRHDPSAIEAGWAEDCNLNGVPDSHDIDSGASTDVDANGIPDECLTRIFVDTDATGSGTGASWGDAFVQLDDALSAGALAGSPYVEIWVAEGSYVPLTQSGFVGFDGLRLLGGFKGNETQADSRDPGTYVTVLSGDLLGDDIPDFGNRTDNAGPVLFMIGTTARTWLDGLTIQGSRNIGLNCIGSLHLSRCTVRDNQSPGNTGGVEISGYDPGSATRVIDCVFYGNSGGRTGALTVRLVRSPQLSIVSGCSFWGNTAGSFFGAGSVLNVEYQTDFSLVNCLMHDNSWEYSPFGFGTGSVTISSGVTSFLARMAVQNVTIADNVVNKDTGAAGLLLWGEPSICEVSNTVLWGNMTLAGSNLTANYWSASTLGTPLLRASNVEGFPASDEWGNSPQDPAFVDPDGPDDIPGNADDDYRLLPLSPAVDSGLLGGLPADLLDLDGDGDRAEPWPIDLDGLPRRVDDPNTPDSGGPTPVVDRGAFERQG